MTTTPDNFFVHSAVRERISRDDVAYGLGVRVVRSGEIALLAKAADYDFLYIDTQHAIFNPHEVAEITQVALGVGIAPFVRVRSAYDPDISLYLDAGVLGIVAPDIETVAQAEHLVEVTKYAPLGRRSLAGFSVHNHYRPVPVPAQIQAENGAVMLFCQIESRAGLDAIEDIASVPGVDGLYVGFADLLADLGVPNEFDGPEVGEVLAKLIEVTQRHGLVPASGGAPTPALQLRAIRAGVRFLMASADIGLIRNGAQKALDTILESLTADSPERPSRAERGR